MTQLARATTTILFSDLVNSTELLERAGDERAQRIFKAHHRLLREAVTAHGGHEVKWLGDGLMVAFTSAADAVGCAVAMQQASRRPAAGERLQIRVGLNVGEALRDEGDYFGSAVVIAKRLCDKAEGGQILASDLVARLLPARGGVTCRDCGEMSLKGIAERVLTSEVLYEHDPAALLARTPFVGRTAELGVLQKKFDDARAGKGAVVMVGGEPGIGKTRLTEEFCDAARSAEATVLWGRCYDGEWAPPFSPFTEAIRQHIEEAGPEVWRQSLGPGAAVIARLVPALHEMLPDIPEPPPLQPEEERYRLLEAVSESLATVAAEAPLVLVLDDLQWADKGTVAMLRHVARSLRGRRMLVLGTYRDVEVDGAHPLADALTALRREANYERVVLEGLDVTEVGELLQMIAEQDVPEALVQGISAETDGNPFFIREVLIHLVEEGKIRREDGRWMSEFSIAEMGIPEGVREVIGRRLARLSEPCNRMLTVVSAMTGGFSWEVVKAISGVVAPGGVSIAPAERTTEAHLLDALDEALAAQLLIERPVDRAATYDFTHALIRHTLYDALSAPRRVLLHRHIGQALEARYAGDPESHLAELAHHFYEAAEGGDADKAVQYARKAGDRASTMGAYEEASVHLQRALDVSDAGKLRDPALRYDILRSLANAYLRAGDSTRGRSAAFEAAGEARKLQSPERLASAALALDPPWAEAGVLDEEGLALLEDAHKALGRAETPERARVLASLALRLYYTAPPERRLQLSREAVAMARAVGDRSALAYSLFHRHRILALHLVDDPEETLHEQLDVATQIIDIARSMDDPEREFQGRVWRIIDLFQLGAVTSADEEAQVASALADQLQQPAYDWLRAGFVAMRAIFDGRFEEGEVLSRQALTIGQRSQSMAGVALQVYALQAFSLRWEQGRLAEIESVIRGVVARYPALPGFRSALMLLLCEVGKLDEARRELDELATDDFRVLPRDGTWLGAATTLAQVCWLLDDGARAHGLYKKLYPHRNHCILIADASLCTGAASRYLALLAAAARMWSEAEEHFVHAIGFNERLGSLPYVAHAQHEYASMLIQRQIAGDRHRAQKLLDQALESARNLGMLALITKIEHARMEL